MILTLNYPFRAVSFQQARFGKNGFYKTDYQKNFAISVNSFLLSKNKELDAFSNSFNEKEHVLTSKWIFLYSDFFTKKDHAISSRTLDIDNSAKNFQDIVFDRLGINDKNIAHQDAVKWLGKDSIIFSLKILKRDEFQTIIENKVKNILI